MTKGRLEAFSDGVIAIIITIMVLEMKVPLLFWLSLVPFVTGWMGENHFARVPVALYGTVLLMCAIAYTILSRRLIRLNGADSALAQAIGRDRKGTVSLAAYAAAIPLAFVSEWISMALYVVVAILWFIPDRRIEKALKE